MLQYYSMDWEKNPIGGIKVSKLIIPEALIVKKSFDEVIEQYGCIYSPQWLGRI